MSDPLLETRLVELAKRGAMLRRRPASETTDALATVFDRFADPGSAERAELLAAATGFSPAVVREGLDLGLAHWTGEHLRELVDGELRPGDGAVHSDAPVPGITACALQLLDKGLDILVVGQPKVPCANAVVQLETVAVVSPDKNSQAPVDGLRSDNYPQGGTRPAEHHIHLVEEDGFLGLDVSEREALHRNTGGRVDLGDHFLFMEQNGVERAQIVAYATTRALLFKHARSHWLELDLTLLDAPKYARSCCCTLGNGGRNIFGPLCTSGDEDTLSHSCNRIQFGVSFDEPAVGAAGNAKLFANLNRICPRFHGR